MTRQIAASEGDRTIRVLIAEDDREVRELLRSALERDGHAVDCVRDGIELIERLSVPVILDDGFVPPDLVITDHRMPHLSGLEALSIMRRGQWTIPVIVITAFGDQRTHDDARRLGAVAVLDKPFDLADLRDTIRALFAAPSTTEEAHVDRPS
ncbi:MAG: response regulator [Polyangiaceae bacterium]